MYNDNPTLPSINKEIDEKQQGKVFYDSPEVREGGKKFYIESYGCQMNFSDSEIVASILGEAGYSATRDMESSDLILINTCSIRERAEATVRKRLTVFNKVKQRNPGTLVGVLGCMAERLKGKLMDDEKLVDMVVGPDAYRDLPTLLAGAEEDGDRGMNVLLSREETYADISPLRLNSNGVTAFVTIRGRERSRNAYSIVAEATDLYEKGYREVSLLGQNVDSYKWENPETKEVVSFANLLEMVALIHPDLRVRFSTSHPKDITDEVLVTMAGYENICKYIHLPVQSGNSRILKLMNRTYDREWYMERVESIYQHMPDCAISSDMITGFCTETEEEHQETLTMMEFAKYSMSYMFFYSERPGTLAAKKYEDDIPLEIKKRRLTEIIRLQNHIGLEHNKQDIGKTFKVLIEGDSKKSDQDFKGRNTYNKMLIFPKKGEYKPGDYVNVRVDKVTIASLIGEIV